MATIHSLKEEQKRRKSGRAAFAVSKSHEATVTREERYLIQEVQRVACSIATGRIYTNYKQHEMNVKVGNITPRMINSAQFQKCLVDCESKGIEVRVGHTPDVRIFAIPRRLKAA